MTPRHNQTAELTAFHTPELPGELDAALLQGYVRSLPNIVANGLDSSHEIVRFRDDERDVVKHAMTDTAIITRAVDPQYSCAVTAFQHGYDYAVWDPERTTGQPFKIFTFPGMVGIQVHKAEQAAQNSQQSMDYHTLELQKKRVGDLAAEVSEKFVQDTLADHLFKRVQHMTSPMVDKHAFEKFTEILPQYNPESHLFAVKLLHKVFKESVNAANAAGVTELQQRRLKTVFDAIAANNPEVGAYKYQIVHDAFRQSTERPPSVGSRLLRRTTNTLSSQAHLAIRTQFAGYEKYLPETDSGLDANIFLPRPTPGQDALAVAIAEAAVAKEKLRDIEPAKVARHAAISATIAGTLGGIVANPASATPERPSNTMSLQVVAPAKPAVDLSIENVAAYSAMPTVLETATSKEALANKAFKAEIDRRVAHSKKLTGMWASWTTVDADVLYKSILKWEKELGTDSIDRNLILAQLTAESQLKIDAVSSAGAKGLTQFMPSTWKSHSHGHSPFNPDAAVRAQFELNRANYKIMKQRFPDKSEDQLLRLTLAAYNAGAWNRYVVAGQVPPASYAQGQTHTYVRLIMKDRNGLNAAIPSAQSHAGTAHNAPAPSPKHAQAAPKIILPSGSPDVLQKLDFSSDPSQDSAAVDLQPVLFQSAATDTAPETVSRSTIRAQLESLLGSAAAKTTQEGVQTPDTASASPNTLGGHLARVALIDSLNQSHTSASTPDQSISPTDTAPSDTIPPTSSTPAPDQTTHPLDALLSQPPSPEPTPDQVATPAVSNDASTPPNTKTPDAVTASPSIFDQLSAAVPDQTQVASAIPSLLTTPTDTTGSSSNVTNLIDAATPLTPSNNSIADLLQAAVAPAPVPEKPADTTTAPSTPEATNPSAVVAPSPAPQQTAPAAPEVKKPEVQKPKAVNPTPKPGKETKCAPGSKSLGKFETKNGKSELCALVELRSMGEESNKYVIVNGKRVLSKYYIEGAEGHAIVRAASSQKYVDMLNAAQKDGLTFETVNSSFRTFKHQADLYYTTDNHRPDAPHRNPNLVAPPGGSEHNGGDAIDFHIIGASSANCSYDGAGNCTAPHDKEWRWLADNADKFGLGVYRAEAWHVDDYSDHWATYMGKK